MALATTTKSLTIGAKYPCMAVISAEAANVLPTYSAGFVASEFVKLTETINQTEGDFYSNDKRSEYVNNFNNADLSFDSKGFSDANYATIYGATTAENEISDGADDTAPYMGFAFYRVIMDNNIVSYQGIFYPKVKAVVNGETIDTKGSSITFTPATTTLKVEKCNSGAWRVRSRFETEAEAVTWVNSKLSIASGT